MEAALQLGKLPQAGTHSLTAGESRHGLSDRSEAMGIALAIFRTMFLTGSAVSLFGSAEDPAGCVGAGLAMIGGLGFAAIGLMYLGKTFL